ncbi:MAG: mechanosensitive ion channel family protein [Kiritimatiellales bacterium]|nr:mechanosensitive ion channel family protein [Kiritimatiellales bacterium]
MLNQEIVRGVTLGEALALVGWILGALLVGKVIQTILINVSKSERMKKRDIAPVTLRAVARPVIFLFFTFGLRQGLAALSLGEGMMATTRDVFAVMVAIAVSFFIYSLVDVVDYLLSHFTKKTQTKMDDMMAPMVRKSLRIVIVILALVQIAQILSDKPITSILAGLGVGGLAVALAAQETIKNFFGSLVIFADKPFELGERIVVGGHDGSIEEVGFRSTRIRTLDGHLVTVPNGELANMMIQNIGKRPFIKRVMDITITYDTPPEKVQLAIDIVKELLAEHEGMKADFPPRVFFTDFNDCSLNIRAIYWYHPPDYWAYLAFSEKLNMDVLKRYNEAGIEFAFPTRTVYMAGDSANTAT